MLPVLDCVMRLLSISEGDLAICETMDQAGTAVRTLPNEGSFSGTSHEQEGESNNSCSSLFCGLIACDHTVALLVYSL